jgi:hypothetical protein
VNFMSSSANGRTTSSSSSLGNSSVCYTPQSSRCRSKMHKRYAAIKFWCTSWHSTFCITVFVLALMATCDIDLLYAMCSGASLEGSMQQCWLETVTRVSSGGLTKGLTAFGESEGKVPAEWKHFFTVVSTLEKQGKPSAWRS